jgi:uncharacterized protein (TIGR02246 family)
MNRLLIAALLMGTILLPAIGQKENKKGDDFSELIKQYYAGWSTLNPDKVASLYAKEADLVFFDVAPLKYSGGWQEYSDNFTKNVASTFSSLTFAPNGDVKTTRKGDMAFTTLTFHLSAKQKDGGAVEFDGRHTIVWEKRDGHWLIVHEHLSKPL